MNRIDIIQVIKILQNYFKSLNRKKRGVIMNHIIHQNLKSVILIK
jgi:hypothetical protein